MSKLPAQHYRRRPPTRRRMRKHAFQMVISVLSMFLLRIFFLAWTFPRDLLPSAGSVAAIPEPPSSPAAASPAAEPEPQPVVQTVRFSATGDNLIHSPIYKQAKRRAAGTEGYSFDYCYEHIAPFYAQQDVNWINQETLCTDELEPSTYPCFPLRAIAHGRFIGLVYGCSAFPTIILTIKALPALLLRCGSGTVCRRTL